MNKKRLTILVTGIAVLAFTLGLSLNLIISNYLVDYKIKKLGEKSGVNTSNLDVEKVVVKDSGISSAVARVYNSVVMIEKTVLGRLKGAGSGFIYKTDDKYGYIMTNHHVIAEASSLNVKLASGEETEAKLLSSDEYLDIAVIRIDKKFVKQQMPIGKSSKLKLGDTVFAIGSPVGGEYFNSVTSGIISGLDRKLTVSVNVREDWVMEAIQVDAAINPGNSGGPLLNAAGEVIGVNSMKLVDSTIEGMGFAIKIEDALAHVDVLEKGKEIERPFLGVNIINVANVLELARQGISIDPSITEGIVVAGVMENTGASKSDLKKGDVIVNIDEQSVPSPAFLKYALYKYSPGDTITVTYIRGKGINTTKVVLTKAD